jgi:hypothetical protein
MSIDINFYPGLREFSLLGGSPMTATGPTTIKSGYFWGSSGIIPTVNTYFIPFSTKKDLESDAAQIVLVDLKDAIKAVAVTTTLAAGAQPTGPITYTPGRYNSPSSIIYDSSNSITLDAQGDTNAQFFITAVSTITFGSVPSITLINNASTCNVFWVAGTTGAGDILFTGSSPTPTIPGVFIAETNIQFDNASTILGRLYAQTDTIKFIGTSSVDATCVVVCYLKGTKILTENGYINIEDLSVGDNVVTKGKIHDDAYLELNENYYVEPIKWLGNFKTSICNEMYLPICIKANALGDNSPSEDLYISPKHRIIIDGKMVCAKDMVNGTTIFQDNDFRSIHYYHLELNDHASIIANGVLSETYKDFDNRYVFENSVRLQRKVDLKKIHDLR